MSVFLKLKQSVKSIAPTLSHCHGLIDLFEHDAKCFYDFGGSDASLQNLVPNSYPLTFLGDKPDVLKEGVHSLNSTLMGTGFKRKKTEAYTIAVVYRAFRPYDDAVSPCHAVGAEGMFLRIFEGGKLSFGDSTHAYAHLCGIKNIEKDKSSVSGSNVPKLVVVTNDGNGKSMLYTSNEWDNPDTSYWNPLLMDFPGELLIGSASTYGANLIISEMSLFEKVLSKNELDNLLKRSKARCLKKDIII